VKHEEQPLLQGSDGPLKQEDQSPQWKCPWAAPTASPVVPSQSPAKTTRGIANAFHTPSTLQLGAQAAQPPRGWLPSPACSRGSWSSSTSRGCHLQTERSTLQQPAATACPPPTSLRPPHRAKVRRHSPSAFHILLPSQRASAARPAK